MALNTDKILAYIKKQLSMQSINNEQKNILRDFQNMLKLIIEYYNNKDKSLEVYEEFINNISKYFIYDFSDPIRNKVKIAEDEIKKIRQAKEKMPKIKKNVDKLYNEAYQSMVNLDIDEFINKGKQLSNYIYDQTYSIKKESELYKIDNPYKISSNWLFQHKGMLSNLDINDMIDIIQKDLNKYKYSYLKFPINKLDDFEYIAYYIQHLKNSPKAITVEEQEYKKWIDYLYHDDEDYEKLKNLMDEYMHRNNKKLLNEILSYIKKYPELMERSKLLSEEKEYKLYRGIGSYYESETSTKIPTIEEIKEREKNNKLVACTKSINVAKNFAYMIGHLESETQRRSDWGVILEYEVNKNCIILDTSIFGSIFGESEVLVDVSKTQLIDYEYV